MLDKFHHSKTHFTEYLKDIDQHNSMFFIPVTASEIDDKISFLCNKTYGLYSCPVNFLKASKYFLSELLAKLMNLSVRTGRQPTKLKTSKICPVYKSEDDTDPVITDLHHCFLFLTKSLKKPSSID